MRSLTCDKEKRGQIVGMLFGAFGQANDAHRQAIYTKVLGDIPNEILSKAVKKLLLESKFLPSIAEIVEASRSLLGTADDANRVREWDEAWAEIEKAMYSTPDGHTPVFSRPEIALTVQCIGWDTLRHCEAREFTNVRAQVRRMYEDVCRRTKEHGSNEYILGKSKTGLLQPAAKVEPKALRQANNSSGLESVGALMSAMTAPKSAVAMTFEEWRRRHGKE